MNANLQIIITTPPVALVKTWCQRFKDADPEIDVATISHNIHMASAFPVTYAGLSQCSVYLQVLCNGQNQKHLNSEVMS